jgi:hypothetical protein
MHWSLNQLPVEAFGRYLPESRPMMLASSFVEFDPEPTLRCSYDVNR